MLRWERFLFGGWGGLVVCRWGELGLGRRRRNRGGEGRQRGSAERAYNNFFRRTHWWNTSVGESVGYSDWKINMSPYRSAISNPSKILSAFLTVNRSHHSYGSAVSNPSVISSIFSTVNRSRHCTSLPFWIRQWFGRKKSPAKTSTSVTRFFFLILNVPSGIQSVITDGRYPSVSTDWIADGKNPSGISTSNYRQKYSVCDSVVIKRISGSVSFL